MTKCRFPTLAKAPGREEAERDKQGSEGGIAAILALPGTHWLLHALYFLLHRHVAMEPIQATAIWPLANKISVLARALQWMSLKGTPPMLSAGIIECSVVPELQPSTQRDRELSHLCFTGECTVGSVPDLFWIVLHFFFHSKCSFILEKKKPNKRK